MALQFVGMKDGHPKVFTPEELGVWIRGKVNRYIEPQNAKKCAEYVLAHTEGSGGGIGQKLDGWHKTDTSYRLDYKHGSWNQAGKNIVQL